MKFAPRENFVVIDRGDPVAQVGLVALPQQAQKRLDKGVVVAIGPGWWQNGKWLTVTHLKVGDIAHFSANAGADFEIEGKTYYIIPSQNIIGVESDEDSRRVEQSAAQSQIPAA